MSKITDAVTALAAPAAEALGLELWDVEYVREAGQWFLRVYIDKDGGVGIQDCEALSKALDPLLDEADPIPDSYVFEVSSAGAERELKRPGDFPRFFGSPVEVRLYKAVEGSKSFVGVLTGYADGDVSVRVGDRDYTFEKAQVAKVRLRIV
ncbi:MAG: ribosome maturation factor RimP [Oscillospiraceae bacterium]|nr:ribosome maturation factor RimP [Oscillospiraceae bacterium]